MPSYWLFKSEPETYSFSQLQKDKRTHWNGVRNFQARNFLRQARKGDLALIYHSGDDKAVVGIAKVVREAYAEIDDNDGKEWAQIDIEAVKPLPEPVTLAKIKTTAALAETIARCVTMRLQ
jgi:predicted RNA-binding protein with PUA-like domain